jgi:hypothetical protein
MLKLDPPASPTSCLKKLTHNAGNKALYTNPLLLNTLWKPYSPKLKKVMMATLAPNGPKMEINPTREENLTTTNSVYVNECCKFGCLSARKK